MGKWQTMVRLSPVPETTSLLLSGGNRLLRTDRSYEKARATRLNT